jgi:hypothetical protein
MHICVHTTFPVDADSTAEAKPESERKPRSNTKETTRSLSFVLWRKVRPAGLSPVVSMAMRSNALNRLHSSNVVKVQRAQTPLAHHGRKLTTDHGCEPAPS